MHLIRQFDSAHDATFKPGLSSLGILNIRRGHWDFRFCGFGYFFDQSEFSVFVSKDFGFSVLVFNAVCGFFVFLASGFRFS